MLRRRRGRAHAHGQPGHSRRERLQEFQARGGEQRGTRLRWGAANWNGGRGHGWARQGAGLQVDGACHHRQRALADALPSAGGGWAGAARGAVEAWRAQGPREADHHARAEQEGLHVLPAPRAAMICGGAWPPWALAVWSMRLDHMPGLPLTFRFPLLGAISRALWYRGPFGPRGIKFPLEAVHAIDLHPT